MEIELLPFISRALVATLLVSCVCGVLGVFVVLRGIAYVGEGLSHAAFAGVALAAICSLPVTPTTIVFCIIVAFLIRYTSRKGRLREDTSTGIFFSTSMALGLILISASKGKNIDIIGYLFGSILSVTYLNLIYSGVLVLLVLSVIYVFFKEFSLITFDSDLAEILNVPVERLTYLLYALIALTVVSAVQLVGVILVSSLLITPAATSLQFAKSLRGSILFSVFFSVSAGMFGLIASIALNTPPGATIALFSTLLFLISLLIQRSKRIL